MCVSMADIQCPTAEIRRGNKKRKKKEETTGWKYICPHPAMQGGHKHQVMSLAVLTNRQTNASWVTTLCYSVVQWKTLGSKIHIVKFKSENGAMVVRSLRRKDWCTVLGLTDIRHCTLPCKTCSAVLITEWSRDECLIAVDVTWSNSRRTQQ